MLADSVELVTVRMPVPPPLALLTAPPSYALFSDNVESEIVTFPVPR